ncbi:MAG: helix-turn-helix domain-containing protein [Patescibacteria group bacterium]|nr:helix-turn-helix domain-containing protein [Patescibacteria group bacterium]
MKELINRLSEYGLSEKESSIYLAMLELGPASVQDIANKSGVNRATTYVTMEALKRHGLMSTFEKGRKTMFVAESPEHLKRLSSAELRAAQEKADRLQQSLPQFMALFNSASETKPVVRFFEGEEGLITCREMLGQCKEEVLNFVALDENNLAMSKIDERGRLFLTSRSHGRIIVALKPGIEMTKLDKRMWRVREVLYESFPFTGDMLLSEGKIFVFVMKEKPRVFLLESKEVYGMLKTMFELIWQEAEPME